MTRKDNIRIHIDVAREPLAPINDLPPLPNTLEFPHTFVSLDTYEKFAISKLDGYLTYKKVIIQERTGNRYPFVENESQQPNNNVGDLDNKHLESLNSQPETLTSGLYNALRCKFILKLALIRYLNYIFDDLDSDLYIIVSLGQINVISYYLSNLFFEHLRNFDFEYKKRPRLRFMIFNPKENSQILRFKKLKFDYIILEAMNFILSHIYLSTGRILVDHVHSYIPGKNLGTFFDSLHNDFSDCQWILKFDHLEGKFFRTFNYLNRGVLDVIWDFDNIYDEHFFFILRRFVRIGYLGNFEKLEKLDIFKIRAYVPLVQTLTNIYMSKFDRLFVRYLLPSFSGKRGQNKFTYIRYDTKFIIGLKCSRSLATEFRKRLYEIMLFGLWRKPWTWVFRKMYNLLSENPLESTFRFMNFNVSSMLVEGKWVPSISLPFRVIYKLLKIEGMIEDIPCCNINEKDYHNKDVDWFVGAVTLQPKVVYTLVKQPLKYILNYYNHIYLTVYIYCRSCNDKSTIYQLHNFLYNSFVETLTYKFGFNPSNEIISLGLNFVEKDPYIGFIGDIKSLENLADFNYLFYKSKISSFKTYNKMPFRAYPRRLEPVLMCERSGWNQIPLSLSLSRYLSPVFSMFYNQKKIIVNLDGKNKLFRRLKRRYFGKLNRFRKKKYFMDVMDSLLYEGYFRNFMYDDDVQQRYVDRTLIFKYLHGQYWTKVEFTSIANIRSDFLLNKPEDLFAADLNTERGINYNLPFTRVKRVKLNGMTIACIWIQDRLDDHYIQNKHKNCWWLTKTSVDNDGNDDSFGDGD